MMVWFILWHLLSSISHLQSRTRGNITLKRINRKELAKLWPFLWHLLSSMTHLQSRTWENITLKRIDWKELTKLWPFLWPKRPVYSDHCNLCVRWASFTMLAILKFKFKLNMINALGSWAAQAMKSADTVSMTYSRGSCADSLITCKALEYI